MYLFTELKTSREREREREREKSKSILHHTYVFELDKHTHREQAMPLVLRGSACNSNAPLWVE